MSEYSSLKATINANIKANNNQEITGSVMNSVLNAMVTTLGAEYQFAGVATKDTKPGTPDAKVFYIANGKGTYTNFGGLEVTEDDVVVLTWDSSWHKVATGIASNEKLSELDSISKLLPFGVDGIPKYDGNISNTKLERYDLAKYFVICVNGGENFSVSANGRCRIAVLKDFAFNPVLPYNFNFASGESIRGVDSGVYNVSFVVPDDAHYVLFSYCNSTGKITAWSKIEIDGVSILNSLYKSLVDFVSYGTQMKGNIPNGVDLNTLQCSTIYAIPFGFNVSNQPSDLVSGQFSGSIVTLRQNKSGDTGCQMLITAYGAYYRYYAGTYFGWNKVADEKDLKIIKDILGYFVPSVSYTTGKHIGISGNTLFISNDPGWKMSNSFRLEKGQRVKIHAAGYSNVVSILAKMNGETPLASVITSSDSSYKWYETTIDESGYYVVSGNSSKDIEICVFNDIGYNNVHYVSVKKDGTGDFTTIRGAVDSITDASKDNKYCILVYEGEYDVLADYTDEEIKQANVPTSGYDENTFVGVKLTDGISIKGVGAKDKVILKGRLDASKWSTAYTRNISTLNLKGNCTVENLTITGMQLRYCVHDDFAYNPNGSFERKVKDVIFKPYSVTSGVAYGAGMSGGAMHATFENCDFGNRLGIHTNPNRPSSSINLIGCKGRAVGLNDMGSHCVVSMENCDFDYVSMVDETQDHVQKLFVNGVGNERAIVIAPSGYLYNTGSVSSVWMSAKFQVGKVVCRNKLQYANEYDVTTSPILAEGIVIGRNTTDELAYIQRGGGFSSNTVPQLSGGEIGSLLTVGADGYITYEGATNDNAIAVVIGVENNVVYAKFC